DLKQGNGTTSMADEIPVPTLGESVTEATIGKWFKKAGDAVAVDEPVVELETDKVTIEVPAPAAGVLAEIAVAEGETVGVGALLGNISEGAGAAPAKKEEPKAEAPAPAKAEPEKAAEAAPTPAAASGKTDMPPSPAAARVLAEAGVSADQVSGSGQRGQVLKSDALDAVARGVTALAPAAAVRAPSSEEDAGREERVKM